MSSRFKQLTAVGTGVVTLALLAALSAPNIEREPSPPPQIRPVSGFKQNDRVIPPSEPQPTLVGEKADNVEPDNAPLAEIDFASPKPNDSPTITTPKVAPMDNTAPTPTPSQNTESFTAPEPKMGDTRTVGGQKQVYFLGFGWIEDNDTPNVGIYADDMYENGNKVGYMGGGEFVDGEGDINKMVGTMD